MTNYFSSKKLNIDLTMNPILTIAIPTYNRPYQIQAQVRLLLPQLNGLTHLVIYDNCSEIPVKELFTEEEQSKFQIIRNRVNVGADANIARCFENCSTKWLWTLSDDDFIKAEAIEIILEEINKEDEAVFFNFYNDHYSKTIGFEDLADEFKGERFFSSSFTMSSCIYNMAKLQDSLQDYYSNLSSMMGTIILVLKYVQKHDDSICILLDTTPIDKYNTEVGWNYGDYIRKNKLFIEAFGGKNNKNFNRTLFIGCHKTNYLLIILDRKESKMNYGQRWNAFFQAIANQGLINALIYTPKLFFLTLRHLIFQHKWLFWAVILKRKLLNQGI